MPKFYVFADTGFHESQFDAAVIEADNPAAALKEAMRLWNLTSGDWDVYVAPFEATVLFTVREQKTQVVKIANA